MEFRRPEVELLQPNVENNLFLEADECVVLSADDENCKTQPVLLEPGQQQRSHWLKKIYYRPCKRFYNHLYIALIAKNGNYYKIPKLSSIRGSR